MKLAYLFYSATAIDNQAQAIVPDGKGEKKSVLYSEWSSEPSSSFSDSILVWSGPDADVIFAGHQRGRRDYASLELEKWVERELHRRLAEFIDREMNKPIARTPGNYACI
jgi:hypothetical protein